MTQSSFLQRNRPSKPNQALSGRVLLSRSPLDYNLLLKNNQECSFADKFLPSSPSTLHRPSPFSNKSYYCFDSFLLLKLLRHQRLRPFREYTPHQGSIG